MKSPEQLQATTNYDPSRSVSEQLFALVASAINVETTAQAEYRIAMQDVEVFESESFNK